MSKRYRISGMFSLVTEAENIQNAIEKARRILYHCGIQSCIMETEEVKEDGAQDYHRREKTEK